MIEKLQNSYIAFKACNGTIIVIYISVDLFGCYKSSGNLVLSRK